MDYGLASRDMTKERIAILNMKSLNKYFIDCSRMLFRH